MGGTCRCPGASAGELYCPSIAACVNTRTSSEHCGVCDRACPTDASCMSGTCVCATPGYSPCGTSCVDRQTDEANCGTCGRVCTGSLVCLAGSCTCDPPVPGTEVRVTNAADTSENVAIAWNGTEGMLVWIDRRSGTRQVYAQRIAADGSSIGAARVLSTAALPGGTEEVDVVWTGTEWGVAWNQTNAGSEGMHLTRIAADGTTIAGPFLLGGWRATSSTRLELLFTPTLGYVTARDPGVVIQSFGPLGTTPSMEQTIPGFFAVINGWSIASLPSGVLGVLMTSSSIGEGVYLQPVNADGSITAARVMVTSVDAEHPVLSHDGTSWVATWRESTAVTSIVLARGATLASRTTVIAASGTPRFRRPMLSVVGNTVTMTWQATADTVWRIDGRRFALPTSGAATALDLAASIYMPTTSVYDQPHGMIAVPGGVILAWADSRWGATEVYEQLVSMTPCAP
jgi:hypothetical protein